MGRSDIAFKSGFDDIAAWLYEPDGGGPHPCIVMGGGFTAVREQRLDAFAERFQAAGLAVLLFDYRHFGASAGAPRQLLDIGRQLEDWRAAIVHARSLAQVDAERVALWGSSFSGGHVVAVAAGDPRIAAVVSQAPFTDGISATRENSVSAIAALTWAGIKDTVRQIQGREPLYIPATGPPGSLAAMTAPEAEPGFRAIDPPGSSWENRFAARVMLRVVTYRPYAKFSHLRCPVLVCVCEDDRTTPAGPAARAAESSPNAELRRYPGGHFEVYTQPRFDDVASDETEFLVRNLLGAARPCGGDRLALRP